jgi:hypothetical protein
LPQEQAQAVRNYLAQQIRAEIARRSFWEFCLFMDADFFHRRPFLEQVADAFQKIYSGEIKALSISMPPRAGKSYITSLFAAWLLGKKPDGSIMRNTCTSRLYQKFSYDTRNIVRSDKYRQVFPTVELAGDKQNLDGWNLTTSKQVGYFGAGVGGTIIGFGATLAAITDDLYTGMAEALSTATNDGVKLWKQGTHDSRMESGCPQIDIGTRWSKGDVIGENMEAGKYDLSIVIPALQNEQSFCEDVKTTEEYLKTRADLTASNSIEIWLAEYQQEPAEVQGLLFRKGDLHFFAPEEIEGKPDSILGYIDPAEGGGDACVMVVGKVFPGKVYVTDVIYTGETVETSVPRCADLAKQLDINYLRVEKNGLGSGFIRDIIRLWSPERVLPVKNATHKGTRIWNEYGFIQKYFYFLREDQYMQGSDYDKFMRNLYSYMKIGDNQQDGAPDASAGLSRFIQVNPNTNRLFTP